VAAAATAFHLHFTPTYSSWINQVERWFAEFIRRQLSRGVHRSTRALEDTIRLYLATYNDDDPNRYAGTTVTLRSTIKPLIPKRVLRFRALLRHGYSADAHGLVSATKSPVAATCGHQNLVTRPLLGTV
jgi:hypothetical protein